MQNFARVGAAVQKLIKNRQTHTLLCVCLRERECGVLSSTVGNPYSIV
jgi:hypothetical protein